MKNIEIKPIEINLNNFGGATKSKFETRYIKPVYTPSLKDCFIKYKKAEDLAKNVDIKTGERFYAILDGTFIFGDLIEALIVINNLRVKELMISTLSLSNNNIDSLANLLNGGFVDELNLIVSDYFYSHERYGLIVYAYEELDKDNRFQLAAASTHTKICLIETFCGKKFVIHGSANLRSSSNIEQLMIEENVSLYDFNHEIHERIVNKYKTINKSLRRTKLWEEIEVPDQEGREG